MRRFFKYLLLFSAPIVILALIYIWVDPFKVIYHYDPFYTGKEYVGINRAYGSTMTYLNQREKYHYNSFIFGNSRSLFYQTDEWMKYLPEESSCFHFDASSGYIKGIRDKVKFIDKQGDTIKNALIVVDNQILSSKGYDGFLYISPPIIDDDKTEVGFQIANFQAFLNPQFIVAMTDYSFFHEIRPYMKNLIVNKSNIDYLPIPNEERSRLSEEKISKGIFYDEIKMKVFKDAQFPDSIYPDSIKPDYIGYLRDIKDIFNRHKTNYRIVISPIYDQIKINPVAFQQLCDIFNNNMVFDFSGVNKWTKDYHNYYEESHYRPHVAAEILNIIYSENRDKTN